MVWFHVVLVIGPYSAVYLAKLPLFRIFFLGRTTLRSALFFPFQHRTSRGFKEILSLSPARVTSLDVEKKAWKTALKKDENETEKGRKNNELISFALLLFFSHLVERSYSV